MKTLISLLMGFLGVSIAQECGNPTIPPNEGNNSRIMNGEEAIPHSFPWMGSIESPLLAEHWCAASLISPNWAITAAHCGVHFFLGNIIGDAIAFGMHDRSVPHQSIQINEVLVHPDYDDTEGTHDIALFRWDNPIELNDEISTICLPDQDDFGDNSSFGVGMNCYISGEFLYFISIPLMIKIISNLKLLGWGRAGEEENIPSDVANQPWALRQAILPLMADQECQV